MSQVVVQCLFLAYTVNKISLKQTHFTELSVTQPLYFDYIFDGWHKTIIEIIIIVILSHMILKIERLVVLDAEKCL